VTPGGVHRLGSEIGADTAAVLQRVLGFSSADVAALEAAGVVATHPSAPHAPASPAKTALDG
jgi:hypothetical protein